MQHEDNWFMELSLFNDAQGQNLYNMCPYGLNFSPYVCKNVSSCLFDNVLNIKSICPTTSVFCPYVATVCP